MIRLFQHRFIPLATVLLGLVLTTTQIGCSCNPTLTPEELAEKKKKEDEEEKKKKGKKEKAKPDFEFRDLRTVPTEIVSKTPRNGVKPGHWATMGSMVVANNFDFQAELHVAAVDENGYPLDIDHENFFLRSRRPASLPKGLPKFFESTCYVPRRLLPANSALMIAGPQKSTRLETALSAVGGGRVGDEQREVVTIMEDYQYYMIVLASSPSSYSYMRVLDTVTPRYTGNLMDATGSLLPYYRFTAPTITKSIPLPSTALSWTSVAVIIWDDIDPALFSSDQQQALLDWLHWGGQIIVSGPRSLDRLRGSFIEPYLPAMSGESEPLTSDSFAELNDVWALTPEKKPERKAIPQPQNPQFPNIPGFGQPPQPMPPETEPEPEPKPEDERKDPWKDPGFSASFKIQVTPNKPVLGVKLNLLPGGEFLPTTGNTVAERWAGRGRVVTTSFPLTDSRIYNWRNFDNFLNNAILRRLPRAWNMTEYQELQLTWAGNYKHMIRDARLVSNLRYFTRDVGRLPEGGQIAAVPAPETEQASFNPYTGEAIERPSTGKINVEGDDWRCAGYWAEVESGVAGWNDFSGAAEAAKLALKDAAKVKIPKADFVFKMVSLYLIILVPVNWIIFRMLGRVEWAWFAAPVIAIAAAGVVIRMAQLDIGFVRSRTDIGIVELQAGFDRAHVTRYTALYTSLSTGYDLAFEDPSALALPLAEDVRYKRNPQQDSALQITFQRDKAATMQGFQVDSSSTAWTHSEQMLTTGKIELTGDAAVGFKLKNGTDLTIRDIAVVRRQGSEYAVAWVENIAPQSSAALTFSNRTKPEVNEWESSQVMTARQSEENEVRLRRLGDLALNQLKFMDGEARLVGWTEDDLPGLNIRPSSSQFTKRSLVLAHLYRPSLGKPDRDANTQAHVDPDYGKVLTEEDFEKETMPEEESPEHKTPADPADPLSAGNDPDLGATGLPVLDRKS